MLHYDNVMKRHAESGDVGDELGRELSASDYHVVPYTGCVDFIGPRSGRLVQHFAGQPNPSLLGKHRESVGKRPRRKGQEEAMIFF